VFQNAMSSRLAKLGLDTSIAKNSEAFISVMKKMQPNDAIRIGALEAYVSGFRWIFLTMAIGAGSALVASLFIKKFSMDKSLRSLYTARDLSDLEMVESK
jgi:hypothetical protein